MNLFNVQDLNLKKKKKWQSHYFNWLSLKNYSQLNSNFLMNLKDDNVKQVSDVVEIF